MPLSEYMLHNLQCPISKLPLIKNHDHLITDCDLKHKFPIIKDCPILINEENSLFKIDDFRSGIDTTVNLGKSKFRKALTKLIPSSSINLKAKKNYSNIINLLPPNAKILVLGGSYMGEGMEDFYTNEDFDLVSTDVSFGPEAHLICDAHDVPFNNSTFDCVIIQAVLEHVLDPERCVKEIHRVLRHDGIVYAETPFMQQVHMRQYDFTRYTHLGHRRLFRFFDEIDSGPTGGPGMALAWSYIYFLRSFAWSKFSSKLLVFFGRCTSFLLKYFDYFLINRAPSYDAAAGLFFLGRKSDKVLSDKDLVKLFKGM